MSTFLSSYKIELYKLTLKKKYIVFAVFGILFCLFRVGAMWLVSLLSQGELALRLSNLALEMLPFFAEVFIPLIIFMAVTDAFASEIQENTLKAMLVRPVTRFKLMLSKALACFTVGAVIFMAIFLASTILELIFGSPVKLGEYVLKNIGAYAIDLVPVFVLVLMAILINMICRTPTLAMFVCFLTYAVMKYCNFFVPSVNNILFTSYNQWHKLWIGSALPLHALSAKIFLLIGSALVFFTTAYHLFDKNDV